MSPGMRTRAGGPEISVAASGVLAEFNAAGVLDLADVHVARRLGALCREQDEAVTLALALTVRALRGGSVCIDLLTVRDSILEPEDGADPAELTWPEPVHWVQAVAASPMTRVATQTDLLGADSADAPARPLVLRGSLLYLDRYHRQEEAVREAFVRRRAMPPPPVDVDDLARGLDAVFTRAELAPDEPNWQRIAAAVSVLSRVTVLAGGPGTGKTTTVAALLALLDDRQRIALAAPTGKAAARLEEAVRAAAARLPAHLRGNVEGLQASTVHRLLGWLPGTRTRFRHHRGNPLPYDVVVVDEMSMVSLTMMDRLVDALRPEARLVLVGDPDQLTSVEAGAVMADITHAEANSAPVPADDPTLELLARVGADDRVPRAGQGQAPPAADDPAFRAASRGVVELTHTWRFGGGISALAESVRHGDVERVLAVLDAGHPELSFTGVDAEPTASLLDAVDRAGWLIDSRARTGDAVGALAALEEHRVLCAHRSGPFGVSHWGTVVEHRLREVIPEYALGGEWYVGRPLLVTQNDRDTQLYNGDTGVMVETPQGLRAAFARGGEPALFAPIQLDSVTSVHAMTVHKAQGSQFRRVTFVLPPADSPLLTRELVYTAITRARDHVEILGTREAIARAVARPANRASGLRNRL